MKNLLFKVNKNIFLAMSLFLSLAVITSCGDDEDGGGTGSEGPSMVNANFTSQVDGDNSLTYSFTNNSVVNGITDTSFDSAWDFGGDGTSTEASPTFTFSAEGTYTVTLTVTASDGEVGTATEEIEVTAPRNRYALITDTTGPDNGNDTGELRLGVDSIQSGRLTFDFRVAEGPSMDIQDGFIHVAGSSTTSDLAIVELRFKDNAPHEYREGASDETIAASTFPEGMPDVWVPIEISWSADGVGTPLYTVIIDGTTIIADAISTTNGGDGDVEDHLNATIDGAANFLWKYASSGTISDGMYHVDNIVVYSSDSGSETVVFEDDFQGRTAGDILDPDVDPESPYHPNTMDASVGEDQ